MNQKTISRISIGVMITIVIFSFGYLLFSWWDFSGNPWSQTLDWSINRDRNKNSFTSGEIKKFKSEKEFKEYLAKAELETSGFSNSFVGGTSSSFSESLQDSVGNSSTDSLKLINPDSSGIKSSPERVSETNTQVLGIDEPDIIKTNGNEIYFSRTGFSNVQLPLLRDNQFESLGEPLVDFDDFISGTSMPPIRENDNNVSVIKAFPPSDISLIGQIDKNGDLLLSDNTLVVFSDQSIYGYSVSDPKSPKKIWDMQIKSGNSLVGARLYSGKLYVVVQEYLNVSHPCPLLEPFSVNGVAHPIKCEDIYHPSVAMPADVTFVAMAIDPQSGEISNENSFIGSSGGSVVYMSENAIYVTYPYLGDIVNYVYRFYQENVGLYPAEVVGKIAKLKEYDISVSSKLNELEIILNSYQSSLDSDELLKLESETENRFSDYEKKHKRELQQTGIVKLNAEDLTLLGNGNVPGTLLNQFSMDEYKGNLRVAVTIGNQWIGGFGSVSESTNDVYILDSGLNEAGSIKDLGIDESIYSVRFVGDQGYVVTFKQIDPFFVLDLSNPKNPVMKGELKIPGYSSYLHPISEDRILGIGEENNKVKLSLFDVSNPQNPTEKSKYMLDEYWSEVLSNQHAFLQDEKHSVFFMPGGKGAYVFSYKDDNLKLAKAVSDTQMKRALYINDRLYLVGNDRITVLNENDWEKVNQLEL